MTRIKNSLIGQLTLMRENPFDGYFGSMGMGALLIRAVELTPELRETPSFICLGPNQSTGNPCVLAALASRRAIR